MGSTARKVSLKEKKKKKLSPSFVWVVNHQRIISIQHSSFHILQQYQQTLQQVFGIIIQLSHLFVVIVRAFLKYVGVFEFRTNLLNGRERGR